ncbi:TnsA endonuclease N-terminal domain-containing protein [Leptolyngbya sp. FACHB-541]|uniref:TnsA endonuclease C-terminal domain-containing protein n=1 Tax=Leptolyngbya sp. FACHB-541 TaxID=2692810 RepID=UPI001682E445|nr:TnsA endonuclease C-terminal domain-containing protein [Leptolyngbya sp. FACHB-541]MBD2001046.1 TnsA endonuclease N-terminal domain-containing protein [Leptolyngbya sp. FACHB-541]
MPRRREEWNQEKFDRFLREKRGEGVLDKYTPWITVRDFPSKGRVSRDRGWKTNRLHHLFSDHETRLFYILEWSDVVIDIREQFPLLDLELAQRISADIGVKYPIDTTSKFPKILTTDFMVTVKQDGKTFNIALTVKPSSELEKKRVIEKFEIERNYYMVKGIEWGLVTENHIPKSLAKNIEWVHGAYRLEENLQKKIQDLQAIADILKQRLKKLNLRINQVTNALDIELDLEKGTSLYLFRNLVARKEIVINMSSSQQCSDMLTADIKEIKVCNSLEASKIA